MTHSLDKLPASIIDELSEALESMTYGSIELIVQDSIVTQITVRNIKKTSVRTQKGNSNQISNSSLNHRISGNGKIQLKLRA